MNKLDYVLISNDPAHKIEIYLDCGVYWKQVNPQLPATLHDIYLQYPNAVMIYVIVDGFMSGVIYRCGNYGDGEWQQYAVTRRSRVMIKRTRKLQIAKAKHMLAWHDHTSYEWSQWWHSKARKPKRWENG